MMVQFSFFSLLNVHALCLFLLSYFPAQINSDPCSYDPDLCTEPVSALSVSQHVLNVLPPVTVRRLRCPAVALVWQVFIPIGVEERGGGDPCGFFASLSIYVMPLHVIYTGLMVMCSELLTRAQSRVYGS